MIDDAVKQIFWWFLLRSSVNFLFVILNFAFCLLFIIIFIPVLDLLYINNFVYDQSYGHRLSDHLFTKCFMVFIYFKFTFFFFNWSGNWFVATRSSDTRCLKNVFAFLCDESIFFAELKQTIKTTNYKHKLTIFKIHIKTFQNKKKRFFPQFFKFINENKQRKKKIKIQYLKKLTKNKKNVLVIKKNSFSLCLMILIRRFCNLEKSSFVFMLLYFILCFSSPAQFFLFHITFFLSLF